MKRKIGILAVLMAMLSIMASGTFAYFTATDTIENVITAGSTQLELREKTADGEDFPITGVEVMPGDRVSKIVTVANVGEHPAWVRIGLKKSVNDPELSAEECLELDVNDTEWTYAEGFYYYLEALEPGESTVPLFSEVYVDGYLVDNEYLGRKFSLAVTMEAVQSENNGTSVWTAAGWYAAEEEN